MVRNDATSKNVLSKLIIITIVVMSINNRRNIFVTLVLDTRS